MRLGWCKPELVAVDGTRMAGNASQEASRDFGEIAREIVAEHKKTDEAEDQQHGEARGDELPEQLRTPEGRRDFFRQARRKLHDEDSELGEPETTAAPEPGLEFDAERIVERSQGRKGWLREAGRRRSPTAPSTGRSLTPWLGPP